MTPILQFYLAILTIIILPIMAFVWHLTVWIEKMKPMYEWWMSKFGPKEKHE